METKLLVIDPQNDFCDPKGALYVPGAEEDMKRLAKMIENFGPGLGDIHVTLDTHHYVDVGHPIFWKNENAEHPDPFTVITAEDVENGKWTATHPGLSEWAVKYAKTLSEHNRYNLVIWPYHCLIGSFGHCVYPELFEVLLQWEKEFRMVDYVTKGSNLYTEHYSAVQADVPVPEDPGTMLNTGLIRALEEADQILLAGEALNFCLANTVKDIADNFGEDNVKKLVLLTDASSPVPGADFELLTRNFLEEMEKQGMQKAKTTDFI